MYWRGNNSFYQYELNICLVFCQLRMRLKKRDHLTAVEVDRAILDDGSLQVNRQFFLNLDDFLLLTGTNGHCDKERQNDELKLTLMAVVRLNDANIILFLIFDPFKKRPHLLRGIRITL